MATSNINTFNPSALVSKTVMGLLEAKPTMAKFANSTHNRVFSEKNKPYAPGTTYTLNIPTYPQIQYGASVNPSAKNIRYTTININTSNDRATSGYINAVRVIDQVSEQLYLQDKDEWGRQFIKPTYEVLHGTINTFLQRQLGNSAAYTVLPRFANDRGFANEAGGRFFAGDISMFTRALDYMSAFNMHNYMDFVFCINSSAYYTMLANIGGVLPAALPTGIPTRFLNQYNEKAVKEGILDKTFGLYIYHTPYIPYHYSGTMSYISTVNNLPTLGTNFTFNKTAPAAALLPASFYCAGYNESLAQPAATATVITVPTITTIPETKGWLIVSITMGTTAQTNTLTFQFNPRDPLVLSPIDDTTATLLKIKAVDPINKDLRAESFTCNVACTAPFTVVVTGLAANATAKFYVPVNFLPYGPDPINTSISPNQYNELQTVGLWNDPKTSIYNDPVSGDVIFKTISGATGVALRHIGNHTKIYGFSTNGLHFVNPPLAEIVGADNQQIYDEKSRMSILTTIQGGVTQGTNILRTSTLWGSGGIPDAIVQIPYYPGY